MSCPVVFKQSVSGGGFLRSGSWWKLETVSPTTVQFGDDLQAKTHLDLYKVHFVKIHVMKMKKILLASV